MLYSLFHSSTWFRSCQLKKSPLFLGVSTSKKLFQCLRTSQLASQHSWFLIIWGDNRWKVTLRWEQASFSLHPERRRVLSTSERHGLVDSEITEVGEDLKDWVTWWSQHCHIPNHHTHTFSEQFQGCPRQLIPALENPLCEEIILIPKLILTWCNLRPSPLVLSGVRGQKRSPPHAGPLSLGEPRRGDGLFRIN